MTPAERDALHREISEAFEPEPSPDGERAVSPLGAWLAAWKHEPFGRPPTPIWKPLDWTEDEDAIAMLLDLMPLPVIQRFYDKWSAQYQETPDWMSRRHCNPDRKTAVGLAFLAWKKAA